MRIIADCGSTKTEWAIECNDGRWHRKETEGLNPRVTSDLKFRKVLEDVRGEIASPTFQLSIFFYGAGCGMETMRSRVKILLNQTFEGADIEVESDLLGACRAVSDRMAGVVGILGTGSNACLFDGEKIVKHTTSTGYVLGDEGSGNHIGKRLLKDFLTDRLPADIAGEIKNTKEEVMRGIYSEDFPNRYMASFVPLAARYRDTDYIRNLLSEVFTAFWREMVCPLTSGGDVRLVGGVAAVFHEEIQQVAPIGFTVKNVVRSPIEALIANL